MAPDTAVVSIGPMMRRRAANALLLSAAALARLADEMQDAKSRGGKRLETLRAESDAVRADYQAALHRYRAVTGGARAS